MSRDAGALILGGGLAGSMAAVELARAGRRVVLVEKSKGPHDKVCGEFLSRESLLYLERQEVDLVALGGVSIRSVRLITRGWGEEADLPFAAFSLSRKKLDEEMLRLASVRGVEVHRGAVVERLSSKESRWCADLRDGRSFQAKDVFLATGKHDLRGWPRPAGMHGGLVAFKMYFRLTEREHRDLGRAVELVLFDGGYAGLQPIEDGAVNLCFLVNSGCLRKAGSAWTGLMKHIEEHAPHLAKRLQGAKALLGAPLAASKIPYGHMQWRAEDGLWRVGDQAAVIPSFCGDGMAIALHSGALASSFLLEGRSAASYQRELYRQLAGRLWMATRLSQVLVAFPQAARLVRAWPSLLTSIALMTRIPQKQLERLAFAKSRVA